MRVRRNKLLPILVGLAFVVVGASKLLGGDTHKGYTHTYGTKVVHYTLTSKLLHRSLPEVAIVPPGGGKRWLLVLLHGRHDTSGASSLLGLRHVRTGPESMLSNQLLQAVAKLGLRAPVVVLLNGGGHSYYHDRSDGPWGSMILQEAIPDALRRFDTRDRVGIGGISMGGFGALHLAAVDPKRFCAVGVRSAALWTSGAQTPAGAFDDAADFDRTDVFAAAREGRFSGLPVWIDDGTHDPFIQADTELAHVLHATFHTWPGGHDDAYWQAHVPAYLAFFADRCG